jgi:hypothetical protein
MSRTGTVDVEFMLLHYCIYPYDCEAPVASVPKSGSTPRSMHCIKQHVMVEGVWGSETSLGFDS